MLDHTFGNTESGALSYSVAPDGVVLLDDVEQGYLSEDGGLLLLTDTDPADEGIFDLDTRVILRQSAGLDNSILTGDYHAIQYGYEDTSPWCVNLDINFDGAGSLNYAETADSNNTLESGESTYSINTTGVLSFFDQKAGQVSWDGSLFTFADTGVGDTSNNRSIMVGVKGSTGHTNADLGGQYVFNEIGDENGIWTGVLLLTFNGDGTGTYTSLKDSAGSYGSGPLSYSVTDAGAVTINGAASGYLSEDSSTVILSDTDISDTNVKLMVGVKRAIDAPEIAVPQPD